MKKVYRLFALVVVAMVCFPAGLVAQSKEDAVRLHKEANALRDKARSKEDMKKAVLKYEEALKIYQKVGDAKNSGLVYGRLGTVYRGWSEYQKAEEYYTKELEITRKIGDVKTEGQIFGNLSLVHYLRGEYQKAMEYARKSLEIATRIGDAWTEASALHTHGLVYWRWSQYKKAKEYYEKSIEVGGKVGDVGIEGWDLNGLGIVYGTLGQYGKAVECREKSLAIAKKLGDLTMEQNNLCGLGTINKDQGQYGKAVECREKSLEINRKIGDLSMEEWILGGLGSVFKDWGQYKEAVKYYETSLKIARKIGRVHAEAFVFHCLGNVYKDWGHYHKATEYYEKGLEIMRKIGDLQGEGWSLINLGSVYATSGETEKAQAHFEKGLAIYQKVGVPDHWPKNLLAGLFMDQGALDKAEPWIKQAGYDATRGRYCLLKSDFKKAEEYYTKLLKSAEQTRRADNLFTAYTGLGRAGEGIQDYEKARDFYTKGMELVEEMRSSLTPGQRANFYDVKINGFSRVEPAQGLTRVNMKLNQAADTIASSEATRARAFSDRISLRSESGHSGVPVKVIQEEEKLVSRLAGLKQSRNTFDRVKSPVEYDNISKEAEKAELDLNSFVDQLWKDYKAYAAVKFPRPVELKDSAVRPDEYLLVFDVVGQGVAIKLIKGKEILETHFRRWEQKDMEADVKKFREPFEKFDLQSFDVALAKTLYLKLMANVISQVDPGTHLTIIPDGILASIPFEMLVMEGQPVWKKGNRGPYPEGLKYVGDVYPISYTQSITALTLARTTGMKTKPGNKLLVMADPVFDQDDPRVKKMAADKQAKLLETLPEKLMSIKNEVGLSFPRLPLTAELADSLQKMFAGRSDLFTGLDARKEKLSQKALSDYGYIVFATHGYFGTDLPGIQEPILALTMVDQPEGQDGFLRMSEVTGLNLNADVVALTACQTGLGKRISGEGTMGMGRAFQYAGARAVLMSLWSVSERSSVNLMEGFFRHLKEGKTKLEALKCARDDIRNAGYKHPFYWAPFILVGEAGSG